MSDIRRRETSGDSDATTLSEGLSCAMQYVTMEDSVPEENENEPAELLKRTLSSKSIVSTTSSFAKQVQKSARTGLLAKDIFRNIGLGSCGSVFEIPGTEFAYKKGSNEDDILRDFRLTRRAYRAVEDVLPILQRVFPHSTIPRTPNCHHFHAASDEKFWSENIDCFPSEHRTKQPIFQVDHIFPLPNETREALIDMFFDNEGCGQQEAKDDQDNKDCLVRLYLGERESTRQQVDGYDTLRNFPLRLNMIEDLEIEVSDFATEMAIGLAIIHWQAQIDGMDVEFVLGSTATFGNEASIPTETLKTINFQRREIHLWMLDFDKASEIELTEKNVQTKLIPAFLGNDPYYPRPSTDQKLWEEFCDAYLKASDLILQHRGFHESHKTLPKYFLEEAQRMMRKTKDWNEQQNIVFAD